MKRISALILKSKSKLHYADQVPFKQDEDFLSVLGRHEGKELKLYVYSTDLDNCREVRVTPDRGWGGEGRYASRAFHRLQPSFSLPSSV